MDETCAVEDNDYSAYDKRLKSFNNINWLLMNNENEFKQDSNVFAEAGLYYIGYSDYVKCFECKGGLCKWEPGDDPWIEHAKYYPSCKFIKENKTKGFIEVCLILWENQKVNQKMLLNFNLIISGVKELRLNNLCKHLLCKICFANEINTVLLPCAHQVSCGECSNKLINCPICNKYIRIKQKVFIC